MKEKIEVMCKWLEENTPKGTTLRTVWSKDTGREHQRVSVSARMGGKKQDYKELYLKFVAVVYGGEVEFAVWNQDRNYELDEFDTADESAYAYMAISENKDGDVVTLVAKLEM